jgi:ornithine cyclodeaminase/alanine dehydrogenase-like protein (mu-crystallin family)
MAAYRSCGEIAAAKRAGTMTLILNNAEITGLLTMQDCLDRLDESYREMGLGRAGNRPRSDIYGPVHDSGRYIFKTMDGMLPRFEVAAIRLNSDVIRWQHGPHGLRKDKQPLAGGGKFCGLIMLFSTRNGEPMAIMPDGVIQQLRVACANALAAKYMAAKDAHVYALLGSGWQAAGQARAMATIRPLEEIRVYSPTKANRERLAGELAVELGITVKAVDTARAAVEGADIIGAATNSVTPVVEDAWVAPHAHVTCVKELELADGILERSALNVVHTRIGRPANYIIGKGDQPFYDHDPQDGLAEEFKKVRGTRRLRVDLEKLPDLGELVAGRVPLPSAGSLTCFVNVMGLGIQFAALGALACEKAKQKGMGREIPTDWLLESEHP